MEVVLSLDDDVTAHEDGGSLGLSRPVVFGPWVEIVSRDGIF